MNSNGNHLATRVCNGKTVTFRYFTMGDMCRLSNILHDRNVAMLGKRLSGLYQASGIDEGKLPMVVAELTREPGYSETYRWLYTAEGVRQAAIVLTGSTLVEVDGWGEPLEIAALVQKALDAGMSGKADDGSIPLSKTCGERVAT